MIDKDRTYRTRSGLNVSELTPLPNDRIAGIINAKRPIITQWEIKTGKNVVMGCEEYDLVEVLVPDDLVKRQDAYVESCLIDLSKQLTAAEKRIEALEAALQYATDYAGRLASTLAEKHYKDKYGFELLPSLLGRIDQIDNMTCGMIRIGTQASYDAPSAAPSAALAGEKKE